MLANFYNNSAVMKGVDLHPYYAIASPLDYVSPTGTEVPTLHLVAIVHAWWGGDDDKRTPNVTSMGLKMLRDGFTVGWVPHIPMPVLPPHPYEVVAIAKIIKNSKTQPFVKQGSVTSSGDPLSCCAIASSGVNLNCQDGGMKLTGFVYCINTVVTSPSLKDLFFRIFDDFLKKPLAKLLTKLFEKDLEAEGIPWPIRPALVWVFSKIIPYVIDGVEWVAKKIWDLVEPPPPQLGK